MFLNKIDDIALFIAGPTPIALPARIDVERRAVVVVERTEAFEGGPDGAQRHVAADDIDNVVGLLDLLDQGYPVFRQGRTRLQESEGPKANGNPVDRSVP